MDTDFLAKFIIEWAVNPHTVPEVGGRCDAMVVAVVKPEGVGLRSRMGAGCGVIPDKKLLVGRRDEHDELGRLRVRLGVTVDRPVVERGEPEDRCAADADERQATQEAESLRKKSLRLRVKSFPARSSLSSQRSTGISSWKVVQGK